MRKYFTAKGIDNSSPTQPVSSKDVHWELYEALVAGFPASWRPEVRELLLRAIQARDLASVVKVVKELDAKTTVYSSLTALTDVRCDRRAVAFLKKFPFRKEETPFDTRTTAIDKWRAAESQCSLTNEKLRNLSRDELPQWVRHARRLIEDVLGPLTPKTINKILDGGNHGPGSTLLSNGNRVTPYYKYMDFPYTVTQRAAPYALAAISRNPHWLDVLESSGRRKAIPLPATPQFQKEIQIFWDCVELVENDRITFVPKDCQTDRPIAIGASLNMYLQLGVKTYLEGRLKLVGVDLTDQRKNQELAMSGSRFHQIDGQENPNQFSTIDLASASDTISSELVKLLLTPEWFALLSDLRHDAGDLNGESFTYSKFSAMGNGYTFPLESLIFWAVAKATALDLGESFRRRDFAVYGDDIIVRLKIAPAVVASLNWCGFLVNQEKSFISGPFKESCGADFFLGKNVRPFYLKREVQTYEDIYFICNSIADITSNQQGCGYLETYQEALTHVPVRHRRLIPLVSNSDCGLRVPLSFARQSGLCPWLSNREKNHLRDKRLIREEDLKVFSPFYVRTITVAKQFSGRAFVRMWLSLDGRPSEHPFMTAEDILHVQASKGGVVTRRKATTSKTQVVPCSNWDGSATAGDAHHIAWWGIR